jgi:tetratricopeptide (TPR) repeat protein
MGEQVDSNKQASCCNKIPIYRESMILQDEETSADLYGIYDHAIADFTNELFKTEDADGLYACAALHFSAGHLDKAISMYERSYRLNPKTLTLHSLGSAIMEKGSWDQALKIFLQLIKHEPGFAMAYYKAGIAYRSLGRLQDAIKLYEAALKNIGPSRFRFYLHNELGLTFEKAGNYQSAARHFYRASLANTIDTVPIRINYAWMLYKLNRYAEAQHILEELRGMKPKADGIHPNKQTCFLFHYILGMTYYHAGDLESSQLSLNQSLLYNPNQISAYNSLAIVYQRMERIDDAYRALRKALELDPAFEAARRNIKYLQNQENSARRN